MTTDPKPVPIDEEWIQFETAWFHCLAAKSRREYNLRWAAFIDVYAFSAVEAVEYLHDNWQGIWTSRIATFGTNTTLHLFNTSTSRVEGFHTQLKQQLKVSTRDLRTVINNTSVLLQRQKARLFQGHADGLHNSKREHRIPIFSLIRRVISHVALDKVLEQISQIEPNMEPCTHTFSTISGLPCKHTL